MRFLTGVSIGLAMILAASSGEAAWFDDNYQYKLRITLQAGQVTGGDHTDFPVLITEANLPAAFFTHVQKSSPANIDIIFTDSTETIELSREIVIFDGGGQRLEAWVKVPTLADASNTVINMYYGYAGADHPNDTGTWSNGFAGVWHLGEGAGTTAADSTSNIVHGTYSGDLPNNGSGAQIGLCQSLDGDGDYADCGEPAVLDAHGNTNVTVEAWVRFSTLSIFTYQAIVCKGDHQYALQKNGAGNNRLLFTVYDTDWRAADTNSGISTNEWYHVVGRYDRATTQVDLFLNGVMQNNNVTASSINDTSQPFNLGRNSEEDRCLEGRLDEVRVSRAARSDGWIATSFNNQNAPAGFYTVDGEQVGPTPTPTSTISPTPSQSATFTETSTASPTGTHTPTATLTSTHTVTRTPTATLTASPTPTPSITPTGSTTPTGTITPSVTVSPTITRTATVTPTFTNAPTREPSENLSRVAVFPNPYQADQSRRGRVTFIRLPRQAVIRIYSISGELVQTIDKNDTSGETSWDLRNRRGASAASGIYLYVVQSGGEIRRGKLAVLR